MKTFQPAGFVISLFVCFSLMACHKEASNGHAGPSSVNIFLTDDPSLSFDQVLLDIQRVEIKLEDETDHNESEHHNGDDDNRNGSSSGGWISVDIHPGVYDILRFRNGLDTLFGSASFEANKNIRKLRITLGSANSVISNNVSSPLVIHDNDNIIVLNTDDAPLSLQSGGLSNIWIDFDAGQSIRLHHNEFELKPSCRLFSKEKTKSIEGIMLPSEAGAIVLAINGTDTATAKPENSGEYKFIGLKPGNYSLVFHATANNYVDQTLSNIVVTGNEDTHPATVTLHQ